MSTARVARRRPAAPGTRRPAFAYAERAPGVAHGPTKMTLNRRAIYAWAMYDWANSVFSVTVISAFFPLFLKQYWSTGNDATVSTFQLGVANAMGGIVVALLSRMLCAM